MSLAAVWELWLAFVQLVYSIVGPLTEGIAGVVSDLIMQLFHALFG